MELKLNISEKSGKTIQKALSEDNSKNLFGKRIGEKFKGEIVDLTGYEFEITGGSDNAGFPMRKDVDGQSRNKILINEGIGFHNKRKEGMRVRKTVSGNTISRNTAQLNVKILKEGKENLFVEKTESAEEKQAEVKPVEETKEEKPSEDTKKEEPVEEKEESTEENKESSEQKQEAKEENSN